MARSAGIAQVIDTWDGSAADYDNDGCTDVLINRHTKTPALYHNNCNGTFTEVVGAFPKNDHHSQAWGDFNGDGLLDLYWPVEAGGGIGITNMELWIQQPDHTFVNQSVARGVNDPFARGRTATAIDVNHDGKLDLFVGSKSPRNDQMASPNRLFLNQGSQFTDAGQMGLDLEQSTVTNPQAADYNGDGWQDLLIVGEHQSQLLRNNGGIGFTDVSRALGLPTGPTRAGRVVDMNGDGAPDLVVLQNALKVYLQHAGTFTLAYSLPLKSPSSLAVGDVNGDGRPDVYVVEVNNKNGTDPDLMLVNDGTGTRFTSLPIPQAATGAGDDVWALDYDNNGLTDFVVVNGAFGRGPGPVQLIAFFPNPPGGFPQPPTSGTLAATSPDASDAAGPIVASATSPPAAMGATTLVSATPTGAPGNELAYRSAVSDGGRYIGFESFADNLVAGDTNLWADIFVRDTQAGTTIRASVSTAGGQANGPSGAPAISADGRYVAFYSSATNLVPGDTNNRIDVFVRDLQSGTTVRASVASNGTQGNGESTSPSLSADGRYLAFQSMASNLTSGDTNNKTDVFLRDLVIGATTVVSTSPSGAVANDDSIQPSVSATGRYLAFSSHATDLLPGKTRATYSVYVRDTQTGTTTRADVALNSGGQANGNSNEPSVSADGSRVAFLSTSTNMVTPSTPSFSNVYLRDLASRTTVLVDQTASGGNPTLPALWLPHLSDDGRTVVFASDAPGLAASDTDRSTDVLIRDLVTNTTYKISTTSSGASLAAPSQTPSASRDNRYVAWSSATTQVLPKPIRSIQVFERDVGPLP